MNILQLLLQFLPTLLECFANRPPAEQQRILANLRSRETSERFARLAANQDGREILSLLTGEVGAQPEEG